MERINKPIAVQRSACKPVPQDRKPQALPRFDSILPFQRIKCTKCGKIGHTQERCYSGQQNFSNRQFGKIPPSWMRVQIAGEMKEATLDNENYEKLILPPEYCRARISGTTRSGRTQEQKLI